MSVADARLHQSTAFAAEHCFANYADSKGVALSGDTCMGVVAIEPSLALS